MGALADRLRIRAPSLYKHLPGKAHLEAAIIAIGFEEAAAAFEAATAGAGRPPAGLARAYRAFALAHPHLYRLMTDQPLPRHLLPPGAEASASAPLERAAGSPERARTLFAFAHGMVLLELTGRFPPGAGIGAAWRDGIGALRAG